MKYYFDINLKPLILGTDIMAEEEAAYIANGTNDPVFSNIPDTAMKVLKLVNGVYQLRIISKPPTRNALINRITQLKFDKIALGFFVTCKVAVDGIVTEGKRVVVPIDPKLEKDVGNLMISYHIVGKTRTTPLKISAEEHILVETSSDITVLFQLGEELIEKSYMVAAECLTLLKNTVEDDLSELDKTITEKFFGIVVEGSF